MGGNRIRYLYVSPSGQGRVEPGSTACEENRTDFLRLKPHRNRRQESFYSKAIGWLHVFPFLRHVSIESDSEVTMK